MSLVDSTTGEVVAPDVETLAALKRDADERNGALQQALARQAREVARLKGEATKAADADPMAAEVREVLEYWRDELGHPRAQIPMDGERAKKTRARLAQGITVEQLKRALELAGRDDWFVQRGFDDPKSIFKNEATPKLKLAVEGAPPSAVVRPIRPQPDQEDWTPLYVVTPLDRAIIALRDEFGADRVQGVWSSEKERHIGWVSVCPIRPNDGPFPMKIVERGFRDAPALACHHGCTEEDLADAVRAIELRRGKRREEAVSRARAA